MRRIAGLAFFGVGYLTAAASLEAQGATSPTVHEGTRVRVDADSVRRSDGRRMGRDLLLGRTPRGTTGMVVSLRQDTLVLRPDRGGGNLHVPLFMIRQLDVSAGRASRTEEATIGLLTGAASGVMFAFIMNGAMGGEARMPYAQSVALFAAGGLAAGLITGGRERWRRVPVP